MKNRTWVLILKIFSFVIIGIICSLLIAAALIYVYYNELFEDPQFRYDSQWLIRIIENNVIELFGLIVIILIITVALTFLLSLKTIKRINAIQNAVTKISSEEYRILLPNDRNDGLGAIEKGLNALAGKIKDGIDERTEIQRAKDDFVVNAAHDLRTPLTSIIGYLALISEKQIDKEISTKYATIASEKAKQLENIIETLFDIAVFTMDNVRVEKQEVNLMKFLAQKQDEMLPLLQDAKMEIRIDVPQSIATIKVDGDLMARVIDNLIINAIRYAKDGKYIDIHATNDDERVMISFITHSNPVPADDLERIFNKFYRLEKSRVASDGGSGLGLSISRRIVELHGGTLIARQIGDGTAFDVCLPN